jgi:uncharacterized membrane protein
MSGGLVLIIETMRVVVIVIVVVVVVYVWNVRRERKVAETDAFRSEKLGGAGRGASSERLLCCILPRQLR